MNTLGRLKILFVEDLPSDAELAERELRNSGLDFESMRVDKEGEFLDALRDFSPDVVVSDYSMPFFDGMSALKLARERDPLMPFVLLTGSMNEDTAVECMKAGASDYVIKEHLPQLPFAVREAIGRKLAEQALIESEKRFHTFMERTPDGVFIVDEAGRYCEANESACRITGYSREELAQKSIDDLLAPESREAGHEHFRKMVKTGSATSDLWHLRKDGTKRCLTVNAVKVSGEKALGFAKDITVRIVAERQRQEISERLSHYLATSPTVTYSMRIDGGKATIQWISENVRDVLGYSVEEALKTDWWIHNVFTADRVRAMGSIAKLTTKGNFAHEYRFHKKDRGLVWLHDEMRSARTNSGENEIVATLTDISERKKIEAELTLKSIALDAAANAIVITDREGAIQWVNPAFETLTGYSMEDVRGQNPRLLKSGEQGPAFYKELWETIVSGHKWQGQLINKRKDGKTYTEEMTITPVRSEAKTISGFIAIKSDVSEREHSRKRLEASLEEKEVLLREIHHRIKNNMQLIVSLLNLSSQKTLDPPLVAILESVQRRVEAMALVHEQLYTSEDMAQIDFGLYLQEMTERLRSEFSAFSDKLFVSRGEGDIRLQLDKAVPACLIASEFVANALEHAYPRGSPPGKIVVSLRVAGGEVELSARDEGIGLPPNLSSEKAESLGMTLVHALAKQLQGRIEFLSRGGTEAILRFPISKQGS